MFLIILVVLFTMTMFLWLLSMLGSAPEGVKAASPWLAWFACLFLGMAVFLSGFGVIVWKAVP